MLEDRVRDVTTTTGLVSIVLNGTPPAGCQSFSGAGIPSGSPVRYWQSDGVSQWECWEGVFTTGPDTLTKVTLEYSSAGPGTPINWGAGAKSVFILPSARDGVYQLPSHIGTTGGTANAQTLAPATRMLAYHARAFFRATIGAGLTNTGPLTFAISGLGVTNVKRYGPGGKIGLGQGECVGGLTHSFFNDGTDIILLDPQISGPTGAGILTRTSAVALKYGTKFGAWVMNNGVERPIPSGGISAGNTGVYVNGVAGQNLAANTDYVATLFDLTGTPTFDFKTTLTHAPSATLGNLGTEIWNGDDTRSVIGGLHTNSSSQFDDSQALRNVASWFNRQRKDLKGSLVSGFSTASGTFVHATGGDIEAFSWADDLPILSIICDGNNNNALGGCLVGLGDGSTTSILLRNLFWQNDSANAGQNMCAPFAFTYSATEGRHQYWPLLSTGGSTGTAGVSFAMGGSVRS